MQIKMREIANNCVEMQIKMRETKAKMCKIQANRRKMQIVT